MKKIKPGCFDCANAVCDECDPNQYARGIGDINARTLGSGARYNAGKVPIDLIPAAVIGDVHCLTAKYEPLAKPNWYAVLACIGSFQMRDPVPRDRLLANALFYAGPLPDVWREAAMVFDYGRRKYATWNWARGMSWSAVIGCAMRHVVFGPLAGEELDKESGLSHRGHFACNVIMLLYYLHHYSDGDDRFMPPVKDAA